MKRTTLLVTIVLLAATQARADLIYQSATAVVTGTSNYSMANGTGIDSAFFSAVDFHLDATTHITGIGGHFASEQLGNNEIFGAIVAVSSPTAPPSDPTLATGVLASTLITLPGFAATATLTGSVNVTLGPGDYAVVFGSGLFGATGGAVLVENVVSPGFTGAVNSNGVSTYSLRQSDGSQIIQAPGARIFVEGTVPEPSSLVLASLGLACLALRRLRKTR